MAGKLLQFGVAVLISVPLVGAVQTRTTVQAARAARAADPASSDLRFAVIGDYGLAGQPEGDVAALVSSWAPDLVMTAGDDNYPTGAAETIDANIGQYYHDFIWAYTGAYGSGASSNRFLPALGNHDWESTNAQPYLDYFELPGNERYYDYVQGPVHFFILDSDSREPDGIDALSTQAAWLQAGLAASASPWDIVLLHHAPYSSSSTHGSNTTLQWPYQEWGADAVIAGHDHTYERILVGDIPYFVNGLGGAARYAFGTPLAGSQVRYSADHGAMLVDATGASIRFRFITRAGALIDDYTLNKSSAPQLAPADFYFETVLSGLSSPILATNAGDGSGRIFIVEQGGRIKIFKNGALLGTPFLDIQSIVNCCGERGLLALAFHPSYATNGYFYVMYTDASGNLTLSRYQASPANTDDVDEETGTILLSIPHTEFGNHNGGTLAFGPDGYLYWSTGDGGGGGDPHDNAQHLSSLLGKILRLDVDSAAPYAIPADNPFYTDGTTADQLIWAYGLRNPWRTAFDRLTGDLYIGDVGQSSWEEVNFQPAASTGGENYGWRVMEGTHCYGVPEGTCDTTGKVLPVAEYSHGFGCSITGGHVYRGTNFPSLDGYYFYGDYCTGRIWSLINDSGWSGIQVADYTDYSLSSFGEDEDGNVYLVNIGGSVVLLGYQDPLAFAGVDPMPLDGSTACTTPLIGADLRLTDETRTGAGGFDISKVKLRVDGVDVTASAKVRVAETQPAARATLTFVPGSPLGLGSHLATLKYATADGPLIAAWNFTVTSGACPTSAQQVSTPLTATAESTVNATETPESEMMEPTAAASEPTESQIAETAMATASQTAAPTATAAVTRAGLQRLPHPGLFGMLLRGP